MFRGHVSDGRTGSFRSLEGLFLMDGSGASDGWKQGRDWGQYYTEKVDRGDYKITGLHLVFCALNSHNHINMLYIYLNIYYYVYIYLYYI